jgi:heptosyltransferase III
MSSERGNTKLRTLDRWIGIPAIMFLGTVVRLSNTLRPGPSPGQPQKIGILAVAAIGDTILVDGVLADIKKAFPGTELVLFTSSANAAIVPFLRAVDRHVQIPIQKPWACVPILRKEKLDWLLDTSPWPRVTSLLSVCSNAVRTVGFRTRGQFRHYGYDEAVDHRDDRHQAANIAALAAPLGINVESVPQLRIPSPEASRSLARHNLGRYVVFHAWPGGLRRNLKQWPEGNWLELAARVTAANLQIVLTGGPADSEPSAQLASRISQSGARVVDLAGKASLVETAEVLLGAVAVVSVDTGILHLAGSLGAVTVGIHGPTSSRRWGSLGPYVTSIDAPGTDCGYLSLGFEASGRCASCMERISADDVWRILEKTLAAGKLRAG